VSLGAGGGSSAVMTRSVAIERDMFAPETLGFTLAEFCRTDPARLKGIAMITEYPAEDRRYDQLAYERF